MNGNIGCIITAVIAMKNSRQMLTSILKTTQIGQASIRFALKGSMRPSLRKVLESQLQEYDAIENEVYAIGSQRGWELPEPFTASGIIAAALTRAKFSRSNTDSRIANMMIQSNTKGLIRGLVDLHQFNSNDSQINTVSQKLLDCETANIRQMQQFL